MHLACNKSGETKTLFKNGEFFEKNFCTDYFTYKARTGEEKCIDQDCEHIVLVDIAEREEEDDESMLE